MRAFFALELPSPVREALDHAVRGLRQAASQANVGWVPAANLHLTLRFLGEVADPAPVAARVRAALAGLRAPTLRLGALGSFGGRQPRVVWAALEGDGLAELAAAVESGCRAAGFPPEARPFRAHVTLGRVRRGKGGQGLRSLVRALEAGAAPAAEPFTGRQVVLFESVLERGKSPVYRAVTRIDLVAGGETRDR